MYTDESKVIAKAIAASDALKFGFFSFESGRVSPYFLDMRYFIGFPSVFRQLVSMLSTKGKAEPGRDSFARVCGVPMAGVALATGVALTLDKPLVCVRAGRSTQASSRRVEGPLFTGDKVLVLDDVCATGSSVLKVADAILSEGGLVQNALVVVDREEGGRERLASRGVKLSSLTTITDVANLLSDMEAIAESQRNAILENVLSSRASH